MKAFVEAFVEAPVEVACVKEASISSISVMKASTEISMEACT